MRYRVFDFRTGDRYKRKVLTPKELREKGGFLPGYNLRSSFRKYDKDSWRTLTSSAGENAVTQIDYILLSSHLAKNSTEPPYIERRGISNARKTAHFDTIEGEKLPFDFKLFPQVSNKVEASDHCPVFLKLMVD